MLYGYLRFSDEEIRGSHKLSRHSYKHLGTERKTARKGERPLLYSHLYHATVHLVHQKRLIPIGLVFFFSLLFCPFMRRRNIELGTFQM